MKVSTVSIIFASLLACSSAKRDHFDTIREVIGQREQVSKSIECDMESDADSCAISDMDTSGTSTLVNPGGDTRCIYSNTGPFKFQVWPGGKMPKPHVVFSHSGHSQLTLPSSRSERQASFLLPGGRSLLGQSQYGAWPVLHFGVWRLECRRVLP